MDYIRELYMPIVVIACLCVGYVMKRWVPADNKWIPTTMLILGAILGCVANQTINLESIVYGGLSGLASTGMHQMFKQLLADEDVATVLTEDEVAAYLDLGDDDDE